MARDRAVLKHMTQPVSVAAPIYVEHAKNEVALDQDIPESHPKYDAIMQKRRERDDALRRLESGNKRIADATDPAMKDKYETLWITILRQYEKACDDLRRLQEAPV